MCGAEQFMPEGVHLKHFGCFEEGHTVGQLVNFFLFLLEIMGVMLDMFVVMIISVFEDYFAVG